MTVSLNAEARPSPNAHVPEELNYKETGGFEGPLSPGTRATRPDRSLYEPVVRVPLVERAAGVYATCVLCPGSDNDLRQSITPVNLWCSGILTSVPPSAPHPPPPPPA